MYLRDKTHGKTTGRRLPILGIAAATAVMALGGRLRADLLAGPDIIGPPASVLDGASANTHQQAFNERQVWVLTTDIEVDPGGVFIPAGSVVSSHMIFFDSSTGASMSDLGQTWSFGGPIIGVMSDNGGALENASTAELGSPFTTYPGAGFANRGLESVDGYTISDSDLTVDMTSSTPGDWIRVVTAPCDRYMGFDPLPLGPLVAPPSTTVYVEDNIRGVLVPFSTGAFGPADVQLERPFFGQNNILNLPNVNLVLDLRDKCVESVQFVYMDLGGFENLQINGGPLHIGEIETMPAAVAPGVTLSVSPATAVPGGEKRIVTLTGPVRRLLVGGQEFWVDKFCVDDSDCIGDINCDGARDFTDLLALLAAWGPCAGVVCPEDLNDDGFIDFNDLLILLSSGPC